MRIVLRNVRVLDMERGLLARALHRLWGTWCVLRRWASGSCEKVIDKDGFFITAKGKV